MKKSKVFFISLGCDKNRVDSEEMLGHLAASGFSFTDDETEADIIVVNTCCFIDEAKEESIETILSMAEMKQEGNCKKLVVAGCMAERYREEIKTELPEVDAVCGVNELPEIVLACRTVDPEEGSDSETLSEIKEEKSSEEIPGNSETGEKSDTLPKSAATGEQSDALPDNAATGEKSDTLPDNAATGEKSDTLPESAATGNDSEKLPGKAESEDASVILPKKPGRVLTTSGHYEFLKIAEGCNKRCTYCVIPYIRGSYRSFPMESLLEEAEFLADQGVKELIVVAQETSIYGRDLYGEEMLPELLRKLCRIDGLQWIRVLYCYPEDISDAFLQVMAEEEKICNYIDMPIQHASDRILKRMGRRTTRQSIEETIERARRIVPGVALRTSLISGFPGETEEDHKILADFVKRMRFDHLGVFIYSREEGTPAHDFEDQIDPAVKEKRRNEIMELQEKISEENLLHKKEEVFDIIVEGRLTEEEVYVGRTRFDAPDVDGLFYFDCDRELMTGDLVRARATASGQYDLYGEFVEFV